MPRIFEVRNIADFYTLLYKLFSLENQPFNKFPPLDPIKINIVSIILLKDDVEILKNSFKLSISYNTFRLLYFSRTRFNPAPHLLNFDI